MKRLAVWMMLVACIAIGATPLQAAAASTSNVNIVIDGKPLQLENSPSAFVEKGRTLVPVRDVFNQLGLKVNWDQKANTATITGDSVTIKMKPGAKQVTVNGSTKTVEVPVVLKENRLFIPIRFVMEHAGLNIEWDKDKNTVYLEAENDETEEPGADEDGKEEEEDNDNNGSSEGKEVEDTEAFLNKLVEESQKLNSYSAKMDITQKMEADGEEMEMDMDVVLDPLGFYQHMTMSLAGLEDEDLDLDDEMSVESYLTKDGLYTYESLLDTWVKYDDDMFEELIGLSDLQMDPQEQFELMSKFIDDLKVYEFENTYEMQFNVTGEGFQELLDFVMGLPELGLEDGDIADLEDLGLDFSINKMSIVTTLDKETLFPINDELESDMTISIDDEEMKISQKATMTYSKHNEIEEIVIPQEVIDSAISFEEYLEKLEEMFEEEEEEATAA